MQVGGHSGAIYSKNEPFFSIGYDDGRVDCHAFSAAYAKAGADEVRALAGILGAQRSKGKGGAGAGGGGK